MGALALGARIVLVAAFVLAASGKVRDHTRVTGQMADFVGTRAAPIASVVVPCVETALAVALVVAPGRALPGWLAAGVLLVFTAVLVSALARHVPCPCFGGRSSARPVGPAAIVRNGVLLALAVLATGSSDGATLVATVGWVALLGAVTAVVVGASVLTPAPALNRLGAAVRATRLRR